MRERLRWARELVHDAARRPASPIEGAAWPRLARPRTTGDALDRVEFLALASASSAGSLHFRLRPVLRTSAELRLGRHGVSLDGEPDRARALLGDALHDLVRADRPVPEDRRGPGLPLEDLAAMLDVLEQL